MIVLQPSERALCYICLFLVKWIAEALLLQLKGKGRARGSCAHPALPRLRRPPTPKLFLAKLDRRRPNRRTLAVTDDTSRSRGHNRRRHGHKLPDPHDNAMLRLPRPGRNR